MLGARCVARTDGAPWRRDRATRYEALDLAEAARFGGCRDGGEQAAVGLDEQVPLEPELHVDPSTRQRSVTGPGRQLKQGALDADGAVGADHSPPAKGTHARQVELGRHRAPGGDLARRRYPEPIVEAWN